MCDMLSGSVERIVSSSWLLLFLERVRILKWIVQRRQKSYHVHTQVIIIGTQSRDVPTVVGSNHHSDKTATTTNSLTSTKIMKMFSFASHFPQNIVYARNPYIDTLQP